MSMTQMLTPAEIKEQLIDAGFGPIALLIEKQAISLSPTAMRNMMKLMNDIDLLEEGSIGDRENLIERLENFFTKHKIEGPAATVLANQIYVEAIVLGEAERVKRQFPAVTVAPTHLVQLIGPLLKKGLSGTEIQSYVDNDLAKAQYEKEKKTADAATLKQEYKSAYNEFNELHHLFSAGKLPPDRENRYQELILSLQNYYKKWQEKNFYPPYVRQTHLIAWCNAKLVEIDKKPVETKKTEDRALSSLMGPQFLDRLIFNIDGRHYDAKDNRGPTDLGAEFIKKLFAARQPLVDAHDADDEEQDAKHDKPLQFHFTLAKQKAYEYVTGHALGSKPHSASLESLKIATDEFKTKWDEQFASLNKALQTQNELHTRLEAKLTALGASKLQQLADDHKKLQDLKKIEAPTETEQTLLKKLQSDKGLTDYIALKKSIAAAKQPFDFWKSVLQPNFYILSNQLAGMKSVFFTQPLLPEWPFLSRENLIKLIIHLPAHMEKIMEATGENSGLMTRLLGPGNFTQLVADIKKEMDALEAQGILLQPEAIAFYKVLQDRAVVVHAEEQQRLANIELTKKKKTPAKYDAEKSMRALADNLAHALIEKSKKTPIHQADEQALLKMAAQLQAQDYPTYQQLFANLQELKDQKMPTGEFRHIVYEHAKNAAAVIFKATMEGKPTDALVLRAQVVDYLHAVQDLWYAESKDLKAQAPPAEIQFLVTAIEQLQKKNKPVSQIIEYLLAHFETIKKGEKVESIAQLKQLLTLAQKVEKPKSTVKPAEVQPPVEVPAAPKVAVPATPKVEGQASQADTQPAAAADVKQAGPVDIKAAPAAEVKTGQVEIKAGPAAGVDASPTVATQPNPPVTKPQVATPSTAVPAAPVLAPAPEVKAAEVKPRPPLPAMQRPVILTPAKQQAVNLLKMIEQKHLVETNDVDSPLIAAQKSYIQQFANFTVSSEKNLSSYLANLREAQLATKSQVVTVDGLKVRVYPRKEKNIDASVHDLFASAIDSSRGALTILEHSGLDAKIQEKAEAQLKQALTDYHQTLKAINNSQDDHLTKLKAAKQLNKDFNGRLVNIVFDSGAYPYAKSANKKKENEAIKKARKKTLSGIQQARDLMWTLSRRGEAVCTVRGKSGQPVKALSLAKRLEFREDADYKDQAWYKQAEDTHPWTGRFYQHYPESLQLSPTPMQRDRPNPANAWRASTIIFYDGVPQIHSRIRAGITPPYMVKDDDERQRLAVQNQTLLTSDELLAEYVLQHVDHWPDLLPTRGGALTVPILHQTLIDPGSPRYYASGSDGPEQMIREKIIANQALRDRLVNKKVFYNIKNRTVSILPSGQQPPDAANCITINFAVKEVNNGVNLASKATIERWDDLRHSQDLVAMAVDKLNLVKQPSDDLELVKRFLARQDVSLSPRIKMNHNERQAMEAVCHSLFKGTFDASMSLEAQRNLALLIQASCKLKGLVHESGGGNVRRRINRAFDTLGLSKTGRVFTALGKVVGYFVERRNPTQKSCYERLLGELLGVTVGGCKSSVDRDGEIDEHTTGLYLKFAETGTIYNYFREENYAEYANTQHKHNMCEAMTGTAGTTDGENNGVLYRREAAEEQEESHILHSTRKIAIHASKEKPALEATTVIAPDAVATPSRERTASAPALGAAHKSKPPVGKPRSASVGSPAVKEQGPVTPKTAVNTTPPVAVSVTNVDAKSPQPPVVEKRLSSEFMSNQLRLQTELNQVAKLVKTTEIKSAESKELTDIHPSKIYKINNSEGLIAVKKDNDILKLYVLNVPTDRQELLKLAYGTIAAFIADQGPKAPLYVNPALGPQLIAAFNAIGQENGLTIVPPTTVVSNDVPSEYKNLNIHLLREQNKTRLSALGPWQETAAGHLEHAAAELAKPQPTVQTLKNALSRLEEDHKLVTNVVSQFPQQAQFLAKTETDDQRLKIESNIKMLEHRIKELENPVPPTGPSQEGASPGQKMRLSH